MKYFNPLFITFTLFNLDLNPTYSFTSVASTITLNMSNKNTQDYSKEQPGVLDGAKEKLYDLKEGAKEKIHSYTEPDEETTGEKVGKKVDEAAEKAREMKEGLKEGAKE